MTVVAAVIPGMQAEGNQQWDAGYPNGTVLEEDIQKGWLYVYEEQGQILGLVCINTMEPEGYEGLNWSRPGRATVIHRTAVLPRCQGKGIGGALFNFAQKLAQENGTNYLKSDTYSKNTGMNRLMKHKGFQLVGSIFQHGKPDPYRCYEKEV